MTERRRSLVRALLASSLVALALPMFGHAQVRVRTVGGSGYELALHAVPTIALGRSLHASGIAYEVRGLADLAPLGGGEVVLRLTRLAAGDPPQRVKVTETVLRAAANGHFEGALVVPEAALVDPRLEVTVRRAGDAGRTFEWGLSLTTPLAVDVLTDRQLYEPGDVVHVFSRVYETASGRPSAGRNVLVDVVAPTGATVATTTRTTPQSGAALYDATLPATTPDGDYAVRASVTNGVAGAQGTTTIRVGRRTVERLQVTAAIDQEIVAPSGALTGHVTVRTPSGAAVLGARVELRVRDRAEPVVVQTAESGAAAFHLSAPAFLSGDVGQELLDVRAVHPAYGTLRITAAYVLARVEHTVAATPSGGGLVPDVDSEVFLAVTDPRGKPAPAGLNLVVSGPAVRGGTARATTDAHGLATIAAHLPRGAAARQDGGPCSDRVATMIAVTIDGPRPLVAATCVVVAPEAEVLPRAIDAVIAPGGALAFDVQRRPDVRGRAVIAEAIAQGVVVGSTFVDGAQARGTITLPPDVAGVVTLRARALGVENLTAPPDQRGGSATGAGAFAAVLVRPADAFALTVDAGPDAFHVRDHAHVALRQVRTPVQAGGGATGHAAAAPPVATGGHVALVARDESALGGEPPFALAWLGASLGDAAKDPNAPGAELMLRAALAAGLSPDAKPARPLPLVPRPGHPEDLSQDGTDAASRGELRDPVSRRAELLRRGLGPAMMQLEGTVASIGADATRGRGVVVRGARSSFDPAAIQTLASRSQLYGENAQTLGGTPLDVAMITGADPSFTFDAVARRIARRKLVQLLVAVAAFTNPDDANAARAASGEPPERWLGKMVRLGVLPQDALVDPWGHPFVLRNAGTRPLAIVVAQQAPTYELVSAGPDGAAGTADDVRDPFERVVARGTPYAVVSGEDNLMQQLAAIGPGPAVLSAMLRAYASVGLAAQEEARHSVVTASTTEADAPPPPPPPPQMGFGGEMLDESGAMNGVGRGGGAGAFAAPASPAATMRSHGEDMDADGIADAEDATVERQLAENERPDDDRRAHRAQPPADHLAQMGELIRERFPATLAFYGDTALDPSGTTTIDLPLADALTTYKLEAIAWTDSGWLTTASGEVRVDQDAQVDAPVPPFGTAGDVVRLPVRVQNRTGHPISARVEAVAEGGLSLALPAAVTMEVAPHDAGEVELEVKLGAASEGALVVRAVRAADGAPLDAVRRPMVVWPDARLVRIESEDLLVGALDLRVDVPRDATARGAGELRLSSARDLFGDPAAWGGSSSWAAWALAVSGVAIPEELRGEARGVLAYDGGWDPTTVGRCLGVEWNDATLDDDRARAGLRRLAELLQNDVSLGDVAREMPMPPPTPDRTAVLAATLIGLAPAASSSARPLLAADLARTVQRLRRRLGEAAAPIEDQPALLATAALALALTSHTPESDARARELLRRVERDVVTVGDTAFLDPDGDDTRVVSRIAPTATLALVRTLLGDRAGGLPALRSLVQARRVADRWPTDARALASAAALIVSGTPRGDPTHAGSGFTVTLDGHAVAVRGDSGASVATLEHLGTPGVHHVVVTGRPGSLGLVFLSLRYGRPWSALPARSAPIAVDIDGATGARDGRAALRVTVRNRGARILAQPIVEVDLPAGVELDQPTRDVLTSLTASTPTMEGRTLRLSLRPLAPGGYVRLPLPLRWSVGGTLRGLGATAWDDAVPVSAEERPVAILASRALTIADRGTEPGGVRPEASPEPAPPPPPPLPYEDALGPVAEVER